MNEPFDLLQERLARLEAGEKFEDVCAGLPETEAELLKTAAAVWAVSQSHPTRDAQIVNAQRQALLRAARTVDKKASSRWVWGGLALGGAAAMFLCALAVAGLAGAAWWRGASRSGGVAQNPSPAPPSGVASPAPTEVALPPADPQHAVVQAARGVVEVQNKAGTWAAVKDGQRLAAGQRVRTGALSSAVLSFYDGSRARLGPNSEVSVDELDAQASGPRVIVLTQWIGDSDHDAAHSDDPASRYEVRTPSGAGAAKGTAFHVSVTVVSVRFDVDEGAVAVTNLDVTVIVVAGQTTIVFADEPPQEPVFRISGEGEVTAIGDTWRISGLTFLTNSSTVLIGDPRLGDWVAFEGRILPDGTRFADLIVLLHRSQENKFSFTGEVEAIGETEWTISGRAVRVDELTEIEDGIEVGDQVEVRGGIADDGTLWASSIRKLVANGFEFTGVVESIGPEAWTISGISVTVGVSATIGAGIEEGSVVHVTGEILEDGTWLAASIELAETQSFDFTGVVISLDPWNVSGIELETDEQTQIDEGIDVGNRVRVRGRVLADGTWLAESITQIDEGRRHHVEFVAEVESIDPWIVGGVAISVTEQTQIDDDIQVGDLAQVKGNLLPDGTVAAKKIERMSGAQGCTDIVVVVREVGEGQVTLLNGRVIPLGEGVQVEGEINAASVVIVRMCAGEDGQVTIVSIIVIYQLDQLPELSGGDEGDGSSDGQITICHRPPGNPQAAQTITVPQAALQAHLNHGDTLGPCGDSDNEGDDDDDD
jgi:hypothetical protein